MTAAAHLRTLRALARQNLRVRTSAAAMPARLREAARAAHADGVAISVIATALDCSRWYAHILVHGRRDR